jgi:protein involved in polysaccharide export with SLBB domain
MTISLAFALDIPLTDVPQISISISGYVENPGTYKVYPVDRLSEALNLSRTPAELMLRQPRLLPAEQDPLQKLNPIPDLREADEAERDYAQYQALRHITVHRAGESVVYDLLSFYRLGEISQNPLLRDGDVIHVPIIDDFIKVSGALAYCGDLEYKAGDTVGKVIDLALGTLPDADLSAVRLSVYQGRDEAYQVRILDLVANPQLKATAMHAGDRLMIPHDSRYQNKKTITLSGQFVHQGEYILPADATLWDAIQMAGGITDEADIDNAVVLNEDYNAEPDPEFERLKLNPPAGLSPIEYAYFRNKLRQAKGRYSVDFKKLITSDGEEGNISLNNADHIYLPQKLDMIRVSGQVHNPGLLPFSEGKDWKYYIEQAGGYANNHNPRGIRVLRAGSGNWEKVKKAEPLQPGDMIFVPDRLDRSLWTDLKDIIGLTASAITIIIGVQNLTK